MTTLYNSHLHYVILHIKMRIQAQINRDIARKKSLLHWDLNPQPSDLQSLTGALTFTQGFAFLRSITSPYWKPRTSGGPFSTITTISITGKLTQSEQSRVCNGFTYYQKHQARSQGTVAFLPLRAYRIALISNSR